MSRKEENYVKLQYTAAIVASSTAAGYGCIMSWTSPAIPYLTNEKSHLTTTKEQSSWIASLLSVGFIFGYLLNPLMINRIGRKKTLLVYSGPQIISWLLIVFANNVNIIYMARIIGGLGYGGGICALTVYLSEIGTRKNRGTFLAIPSLSLYIGFLFVMLLGAFVSYNSMNVVILILQIFFAILFLFMPDSSYFLEKNTQCEENMLKLMNLSSSKEEETENEELEREKKEEETEEEIEEENLNIKEESKPKILNIKRTNLWKLLAFSNNRRALMVVTFIAAQEAFSGASALPYFAQQIFTYKGSSLKPETSTLVLGVVQLIACITSAVIIERIRRKILLLSAGIFATISLGLVSMFFFFEKHSFGVSSIRWLPIFGVVVYAFMLIVGSINLFYVYQGELFPSDVKSVAITVSKITYRIFVFLVIFRFQELMDFLGFHGIFLIFAVCNAIGTFIIFIITPETKGKRLEDIQVILKSGKKCFFNHY